MHGKSILGAMTVFLGLVGCATGPTISTTLGHGPEPTTNKYTTPEASGLVEVRPYPNPDDVCVVIGENDATVDLLDHTAMLIGCPKHEKGAIANKLHAGASVVAHARHWTLLSVPN